MPAFEHVLHVILITLSFLTAAGGIVFVASDFGSKQCLSIRLLLVLFALCIGAYALNDYLAYLKSPTQLDPIRFLMFACIAGLQLTILVTICRFLYSYYHKASSSLGYNVFLSDMALTKSQRAAIQSRDYVNIGG